MASTEFYTDLDIKYQQIKNARIENVSSLPENKVGRLVYLTTDVDQNKKGFYYSTGTEWLRVTIKSETDAIIKDVADLKTLVGSGADGTTLAGRITSLETTVNGKESEGIVGLVAKVSTNAGNISTLQTNLANVKTTAENAAAKAADNASAITALDGKVGTLETEMDTAQTDIGNLQTWVGKTDDLGLRAEVKALKTTVGDDFTGLVKGVADNQAAITRIDGSITTLTQADATEKKAREDADKALGDRLTTIEGAGYITNEVSDLKNYYKKTETLTASEVQDKINTAISSAYTVQGSLAASEITNVTAEGKKNGYVYNVTTDFTLGGVKYPAGTNIVWVEKVGEAGYWDVLAGLGNFEAYAKTEDVTTAISTAKSGAISEAKSYTNTKAAEKVDKTTTVNGHALSANITLDKADVGLGNVDNTADADKPISTATQTALSKKVNTLTAPQKDGTTYAKVVLDAQGLVKSGFAKISKDDIEGTIDASQITNFKTEVISAGKVKIGPVDLAVVNDTWTSVGSTEITDFPSAITAYKGTGEVIMVALKYDSFAKRVQYQVNEPVTGAYIVVSL